MNPQKATDQSLADLRQTLKDKFATAHRDFRPREKIVSGIDWLDHTQGLERGAIYEISGRCPSAGAIVIGQILAHVFRNRERLILIDGSDSFDPGTLPIFGDSLHDLDGSFAWARCRSVKEAVQVADLILRDGNLPRTIIDLQNNSPKSIRAIPRSSWLRLRALAEDSGVSSLIITPEPTIACAAHRFEISQHFGIADIEKIP